MTRIKICGLTRPEDIEAVNACCPDYIGFVFWEKSRRYVTPEEAGRLRERLRPGIRTVGVFVDASAEEAAALLSDGTIDIAQLHGHEDASYVRTLRDLIMEHPAGAGTPDCTGAGTPDCTGAEAQDCTGTGTQDCTGTGTASKEGRTTPKIRILQAFKIRKRADILSAAASAADMILLDNGMGTGACFDWSVLGEGVQDQEARGDGGGGVDAGMAVGSIRTGIPGRPFFLAGGLNPDNAAEAVRRFRPYAVDVSSGVERGGRKDPERIRKFVAAVREADRL